MRHQGPIAADRLLTSLQLWAAANDCLLRASRLAAQELTRSRSLRQTQDAEYEAALRADMERQQLELQREHELAEQLQLAEQKEAETSQRLTQDVRERRAKAESLPPEPDPAASGAADVVEVAVRLPNGRRVGRSFVASTPISTIRMFLESLDADPDSPEAGGALVRPPYLLCTSFPRQVLADNQPLSSLGQARKLLLNVEPLAPPAAPHPPPQSFENNA